MHATPDSRIRADWTLPAETAAPPPTVAPDTSTIAGKVRVMDASARGESVQQRAIAPFVNATNCDWAAHDGEWNWSVFDYRIAPPPARPMDPYSRAKRYLDNSKRGVIEGVFCDLVDSLEIAPIVHIHGSGSQANIDWTKTDSRNLTSGRYRLLRDDA